MRALISAPESRGAAWPPRGRSKPARSAPPGGGRGRLVRATPLVERGRRTNPPRGIFKAKTRLGAGPDLEGFKKQARPPYRHNQIRLNACPDLEGIKTPKISLIASAI